MIARVHIEWFANALRADDAALDARADGRREFLDGGAAEVEVAADGEVVGQLRDLGVVEVEVAADGLQK